MRGQQSAPTCLSWVTMAVSSCNRKWNVDRHPGRRVSRVLILLLLIAAESSSTVRPTAEHGRSHRYAGEHIHVGRMSDSDCPVKPPCYCTDSVTTTSQQVRSSGSTQWTSAHRRHDAVIVAQRIVCDSFDDVRRPRRKWSRSRSRSRSRSLRRFPRFVESNVAVERHVLLSYSGLMSIPGAAFHAIKVRPIRITGRFLNSNMNKTPNSCRNITACLIVWCDNYYLLLPRGDGAQLSSSCRMQL